MYMNIAALVLLLAITWVWMNRGFFSALLHMACTIAAGAIAFAAWEPLAALLIGLAPDKGFLTILMYIAWGVGLLLPFGLALLALRFLADSVVGMNVKPLAAADYAGGGICGFVSGTITVGILVIGVGYMPLGTGFMGYRPINFSQKGGGSLERAGGLWVKSDRLTAGLYGQLSKTSLRTGRPLADWHPAVDVAGYAINTSAAGGMATPAISSDDFRIIKAYTVGDPSGTTPMSQLLVESDRPDALVQNYLDINGNPVSAGTLFGVVVEFGSGAKEPNGQVVMGNGQAMLIMEDSDGNATVAHPVALISQARSADAGLYGRWKFDSVDVFIASVGGAASSTMAFEFVVPSGHTPRAVSIKNSRVVLDQPPATTYATAPARFAALAGGSLIGGASIADVDTSDAERVTPTEFFGGGADVVNPIMPSNNLGFTFEVRQKGSIEIDGSNRITRGSGRFRPQDVNNRGIDRRVLVDRLAVADDVVMVMVNVSPNSAASMLGRAARSVERVLPPQLIDTNGTVYPAVGYIYQDSSIIEVSYDPAQPIRGLSQLPSISSSRTDQSLKLIFRCSKGVQLDFYSIGSKAIVNVDPPLLLDMNQN